MLRLLIWYQPSQKDEKDNTCNSSSRMLVKIGNTTVTLRFIWRMQSWLTEPKILEGDIYTCRITATKLRLLFNQDVESPLFLPSQIFLILQHLFLLVSHVLVSVSNFGLALHAAVQRMHGPVVLSTHHLHLH